MSSFYNKRPFSYNEVHPPRYSYDANQYPYYGEPVFKRPRRGFNYSHNRHLNVFSALNVANVLFISGSPGKSNALLKNFLSPTTSVFIRCGLEKYNLTFSLVNNETISHKGKLEFEIPFESLVSAKLSDISEEPNQLVFEDSAAGAKPATFETSEGAEPKKTAPSQLGAKDSQKLYSLRLVLVLNDYPPKIISEDNELFETTKLDEIRIIVAEFKGKSEVERIDPKSVLTKIIADGPLKGFDDEKVWLHEGEYIFNKLIKEFVDPSRELENFLNEKVECEMCREQLERGFLSRHKNDVCQERTVECTHCGSSLRVLNMSRHQQEECQNCLVECQNGCPVGIRRVDLATHYEECPNTPAVCSYAGIGCQREVLLGDIPQHMKEDADHHIELLWRRVQALEERCGVVVAPAPSCAVLPQETAEEVVDKSEEESAQEVVQVKESRKADLKVEIKEGGEEQEKDVLNK